MLLHSGHEPLYVRSKLIGPLGLGPGLSLFFGDQVILDVVHAVDLATFQDLVEQIPELLAGENPILVKHSDKGGHPSEGGFPEVPA